MKRIFTLFAIAMSPFSLFSNPLEVGAEAPALTVTTQDGEDLDLGDLYAKGPVVVYFYPKSDTPGCTKQACNIRDNYSGLQAAGVQVIGVSSDPVDKQKAFQEKYSLPFPIIADEDKRLGKAFDTGTFAGMAYKRQTFLVVDGKIAWRDLSANPTSQSEDVLKALKSLEEGA